MEVKMIEYRGKKIAYMDFRGAKDENDMITTLKQEYELERKLNERNLYRLANFENTYLSQKFMDEAKKMGKDIAKNKTVKSAFVGIVGVKKILLGAYIAFSGEKNFKTFDDEEDAKNWLVE